MPGTKGRNEMHLHVKQFKEKNLSKMQGSSGKA